MHAVVRLLGILSREARAHRIPEHLWGTHAVAARRPDGSEEYFAVEVRAHELRVVPDDWSDPEPLCIDTAALSAIVEGKRRQRASFFPSGHPLLRVVEHLLGGFAEARP